LRAGLLIRSAWRGLRPAPGADLGLCFIVALVLSSTARADIIDRVLAVVDGALITQSDVLGATRLGLVQTAPGGDPVQAALDRLIERRLILAEVDRYAPPDPPDAAVEGAFDVLRNRVGAAALEVTLRQTGETNEQLHRYLRDDLRIEAYLQERFGTIQPSDLDIAEYYTAHSTQLGQLPPQQAREAAIAALTKEHRSTVIQDWIAGLRRRANINILPRQQS
jgi:hypothetical protein